MLIFIIEIEKPLRERGLWPASIRDVSCSVCVREREREGERERQRERDRERDRLTDRQREREREGERERNLAGARPAYIRDLNSSE